MNKINSLFIRCLLLIPATALVLALTTRPVPDSKSTLQPIAFHLLPPYKDPHLSVDRRVEDLLARMNVDEKIRQLDMYWGKEVADMSGHEASAWSEQKTAASLGTPEAPAPSMTSTR